MAKRSHGYRNKTRHKMTKRGVTPITRYLQSFAEGTRVVIEIDPAIHHGHPHPRYHGRNGVVQGKQGDAYLVDILDGDKPKTLIALPVHLKPL